MAGLLDGLEKIGLGNLEGMDLYTDKEKAEAEKKKTPAPEIKETDFIFDKTYECPVCKNHKGFKGKNGADRSGSEAYL